MKPENETATVLLVDDDAETRKTLAMIFSLFGLKTEQAADGRQALSLVETRSFDLIVLDIVMPDISGLEVLRQLRQREETQQIPIIMLTGETEPGIRKQALALGAEDYLLKPFDLEELERSIQRFFHRYRFV